MKKIFLSFALIMGLFCLVACESATEIEAGFINEITSAGSENYGVRITYSQDSRLDGKSVDTQVKFSQKGEIVMWQEGGEKFTYTIEDYDYWYSLTTIFAEAQGESVKFEKFEKATAKTYLFNSDQNQELTFRAVVGETEADFEDKGDILLGSEPISSQFRLKITKK